MRFSLVYPEYRLLDLKALTEYHAACAAASPLVEASGLSNSGQTLLFLDGSEIKLTAEEYSAFVNACSSIYSLLMYTTLNAFFVLIHKLCIDPNTEPGTEYGSVFTVDLDYYLKWFKALSKLSLNDELYSHLVERLISASADFPDVVQDELNRLKREGKFTIASEFSSLVTVLRENPRVAEIITDYMQIAIVDSYSKILFKNETVLMIYADLPALREGVTKRFSSDTKGIIKTYAEVRDEYRAMVRDLTFYQDQNLTSIYQKYIGSNVDRIKGAVLKANNNNSYSMLEMKGGDGKANAIIDLQLNRGTSVDVKEDMATIEPGLLFSKVYELDSKTAKDKIRKRVQLLALVDAFNFGYSLRARCKYPIKFIDSDATTSKLRWIYSFHRNWYQGSTPGVTELHLPLSHIVDYILRKELSLKKERLEAIWKQIRRKYSAKYSFSVQMPDNVYLQKMLSTSDTQSYNAKIVMHDCYVRNIDTHHLTTNNWLYFAWRLNNISKNPEEDFNQADALIKYKRHIHGLASGEGCQAFSSIYADTLNTISDYRLVINELYRLDTDLKAKGMSLSKFWYIYLSNNFERLNTDTRKIINAYSYIFKALSTPAGYASKPARYSADAFLKEQDKLAKVKPAFVRITNGLTQTTEGRTETVFATFRKSVHPISSLLEESPKIGGLAESNENSLSRIVEKTYRLFKQTYFSNISDLILSSTCKDKPRSANNYDFMSCMLELLKWLEIVGLGERVYHAGIIPSEFKLNTEEISKYKSTTDIINVLQERFLSELATNHYSHTIPFIEMALAYILPMGKYIEIFDTLAHEGILSVDTDNQDNKTIYLADIARRMSQAAFCISAVSPDNAKSNAHLAEVLSLANKNSFIFVCLALKCISDDPKKVVQFIVSHALSLIYAHNDIAISLERLVQPLLTLDALTQNTLAGDSSAFLTSLLIALDNFRAAGNPLSKIRFKKTDIISVDQSELSAALLFEADTFDFGACDSWDMTVDPKELGADVFDAVKKGKALDTFSFEDIKHCTFYFYCLAALRSFYFEVTDSNKAIQSTLNNRLYLQKEFRPFEFAVKIPPQDCQALFINLYKILGPKSDLKNEYIKSAADRISSGLSYSSGERGFFNIKQYSTTGMELDEKFLNFVIRSESTATRTTGAEKCFIARYSALYYKHSSGVYVCGRAVRDDSAPLILTEEDLQLLLSDLE